MPSPQTAAQFQILKSDLHQHRIVEQPLPAPGPGQALLKVDRVALTANNVTYGLLGESFGYWKFFPARNAAGEAAPEWGVIPVWGFADVIASEHESLQPGQRYYGYLPAATHLLVEPGRSSAAGFLDAAAHRAGGSALYNQYALCSADPAYRASEEDYIALLRPLFATSFLLEDFIRDSEYFGARSLILSSASSKTALGAAYLLAEAKPADVRLIALTSARNRDFVRSLELYDELVLYGELDSLDASTPAAYFDFAGDGELRAKLHARFGDALQYSCKIGTAHPGTQAPPDESPDAGPEPELFFAPARAKKRMRDWKPAGFAERMAKAWAAFLPVARAILEIEEIAGPENLATAYDALLDGTAPAQAATIVRL